jgi:hypothetical protein
VQHTQPTNSGNGARQRQNWATFGLGVAALAGFVVAGVPAASPAHELAAKVAVVSPLSGPVGYADPAGDTTCCRNGDA